METTNVIISDLSSCIYKLITNEEEMYEEKTLNNVLSFKSIFSVVRVILYETFCY